MFRIFCWAPPAQLGFPRIRGDVPGGMDVSQAMDAFSPHTRGCSAAFALSCCPAAVFPAYAGMFLEATESPTWSVGFPRIRGDVPMKTDMERLNLEFSPHTRGCSAAGGRLPTAGPVFPAYAGMFRRSTRTDWLLRSFPRIRGDVPLLSRSASKSTAFSPHTRGCSGLSQPVG